MANPVVSIVEQINKISKNANRYIAKNFAAGVDFVSGLSSKQFDELSQAVGVFQKDIQEAVAAGAGASDEILRKATDAYDGLKKLRRQYKPGGELNPVDNAIKKASLDPVGARQGRYDTVTSSSPDPTPPAPPTPPPGPSAAPTPNSSNANAGVNNFSQDVIDDRQLLPVNQNQVPSVQTPEDMAAARQAAARRLLGKDVSEEVKKAQNNRDIRDEVINAQLKENGLFGKYGKIRTYLRGEGASNHWLFGMNTRKLYYDSLDAIADNMVKKYHLNKDLIGGRGYNRITNRYQNNFYSGIRGNLINEYWNAGGAAAGIRGGIPTTKEMIKNPDLMAKMINGDYLKPSPGLRLDGIADWAKENPLKTAGIIATTAIVGSSIIDRMREGD